MVKVHSVLSHLQAGQLAHFEDAGSSVFLVGVVGVGVRNVVPLVTVLEAFCS